MSLCQCCMMCEGMVYKLQGAMTSLMCLQTSLLNMQLLSMLKD